MPLHPRIARALKAAEKFAPYDTLPVDQARAQVKLAYPPREPPIPVQAVEDRAIPGPGEPIPIRIYWPEGTGPFPLLVFFHGSGFVLLDLDTHDDICRRLMGRGRCGRAHLGPARTAYQGGSGRALRARGARLRGRGTPDQGRRRSGDRLDRPGRLGHTPRTGTLRQRRAAAAARSLGSSPGGISS